MAGDSNPMNTFMLRRFISLTMVSAAALALFSSLGATAAQAAEPPAAADTAASAPPAPRAYAARADPAASAAPAAVEEAPDHPEDWNTHHPRRSHHRNSNDLFNIGHD